MALAAATSDRGAGTRTPAADASLGVIHQQLEESGRLRLPK
jgi:hypothetical protein